MCLIKIGLLMHQLEANVSLNRHEYTQASNSCRQELSDNPVLNLVSLLSISCDFKTIP